MTAKAIPHFETTRPFRQIMHDLEFGLIHKGETLVSEQGWKYFVDENNHLVADFGDGPADMGEMNAKIMPPVNVCILCGQERPIPGYALEGNKQAGIASPLPPQSRG